jgi:succinyl-diaminopimelate desuccinylase
VDERALAERLITYDTSAPDGLRAAAGFVKGWLEAREIDVQDHVFRDMPVLTATVGPDKGPTVVLHGHLDVVPGHPEQFHPRIEGDRLYGRGAYDMKSGLAAALIACRDAPGDVLVAAVADEEHASSASRRCSPPTPPTPRS